MHIIVPHLSFRPWGFFFFFSSALGLFKLVAFR